MYVCVKLLKNCDMEMTFCENLKGKLLPKFQRDEKPKNKIFD